MIYKIWPIFRRDKRSLLVHRLKTVDTEEAADAFIRKAEEAVDLLHLLFDYEIKKDFIDVEKEDLL